MSNYYQLSKFMFSIVDTQPRDSIDYQIAQYILTHMNELDRASIGQLAAQCGVSKSSISRFCRKIGLEDYLDLQLMCRNYTYDPAAKFRFAQRGTTSASFLDASIAALTELKARIQPAELDELVHDLHGYAHVAAMGLMQSGNVALNLQHDLSACGRFIDCSQTIALQREYLQQAGADTLLLIFSVKGHFFDTMLRGFSFSAASLPKIYLITLQNDPSPDFVYKTIRLASQHDFANSILLLQTYASMLALRYYEMYCG